MPNTDQYLQNWRTDYGIGAARNKTFFASSGDQMWLANDIRMILKPYSAVITAPVP